MRHWWINQLRRVAKEARTQGSLATEIPTETLINQAHPHCEPINGLWIASSLRSSQ
jgi:hypothetical protein